MSKTAKQTKPPSQKERAMAETTNDQSREAQGRDMFTIHPEILAGGPMPRPVLHYSDRPNPSGLS